MSKSQTATEYLIILGVVVFISIVVVGTFTDVINFGSGISEQESRLIHMSAEVSLFTSKVTPYYSELIVKSMSADLIEINSVTSAGRKCQVCDSKRLSAGKQSTIRCGDITEEGEGDLFRTSMRVEYSDSKLGSTFIEDYTGADFVGTIASSDFQSPEGVLVWNTTYDGVSNGLDEAEDVYVDSCGNIYVVGSDNRIFGDTENIVTLKYNEDGVLLWERLYGGSIHEAGKDITVSSQGNVVVVGETESFGGSDLDLAIVVYDALGNVLWNDTWGGSSSDYGSGVFVSDDDNIYVTGMSSTGGTSALVLKYDMSGNLLWNISWGSDIGARGEAIQGIGNDEIYIAGHASISGNTEVFLLKIDSEGNVIWDTYWDSGTGADFTTDMSISDEDEIYVSVRANTGSQNMGLLKFDTSGNLDWEVILDYSTGEIAYGVAVDKQNNVYLSSFIYTGPTTLNDLFVFKFDSQGNELWNLSLSSSLQEIGKGIFVDAIGEVYVSGFINNDFALLRIT